MQHQITGLYSQGYSEEEICAELNIKKNTYQKAKTQKRIILPVLPVKLSKGELSTKSSRSVQDNTFGMGKSCSYELERVLACKMGVPAQSEFSSCMDLSHGGLLLTIPSLLACGLLRHISLFNSVSGYYSPTHVFLSLAFLMLLRVKRLEQTDTYPAGELGRCLGLDRIPEVKTLRSRIAHFCCATDVEQWLAKLSSEWMQVDEALEGVLYVDGHVNLYYGSQTQMPKRFVSRLRLCMSGSTDYWVSNRMGAPFFVVHKTVNEGMIKTLTGDIIPRLNKDVPNQPTQEELRADPELHRYMLVFDRECYSIDFFIELETQRIAFCTYRKYVQEDWPEEEFADYETVNENGEKETMKLAERKTVLCSKKEKGKPQKEIAVREIRKKTTSGHQTSIITINRKLAITVIATFMFARWCQEIFFKYMVESFGIDSIVSYLKNLVPDMSSVVNPIYKDLERQHKSIATRLRNLKLKYADISLQDKELSQKQIEQYTQKKSDMKLEIESLEKQRTELIEKKKSVEKKLLFKDLEEDQKFQTAVNERKFFLDTIKIIAYRAETALCNIIEKRMASPQQARSLMRKLYSADADIEPDYSNHILKVNLHRTNHWADDDILLYLCEQLNDTQTVFPDTKFTIRYELLSS